MSIHSPLFISTLFMQHTRRKREVSRLRIPRTKQELNTIITQIFAEWINYDLGYCIFIIFTKYGP